MSRTKRCKRRGAKEVFVGSGWGCCCGEFTCCFGRNFIRFRRGEVEIEWVASSNFISMEKKIEKKKRKGKNEQKVD